MPAGEIVENRNTEGVFEQKANRCTADVACATCDEDVLRHDRMMTS